jgi:two-component system chemotaxis sensor kinase CheA
MIEIIFREVHSLKGAARTVNLKDVEFICQPLEGAFAAMKRLEITSAPALFDLFHQAVDAIAQLVSTMETNQKPKGQTQIRELVRQLGNISKGILQQEKPEELKRVAEAQLDDIAAVPPPPKEVQVSPHVPISGKSIEVETVRIPTAILDPLLLQAEEMIQAKIAAGQRVAELQEINRLLVSWRTESTKWKDEKPVEGVQQRNDARLAEMESRVVAVTQEAEGDQRALRRMIDEHLEAMKKVLMLPVATLTEVLPKFVRDLARDQNKEVTLVIRGAEIEIDMRILQELKDPLIHLARNCVDHGIERPEARARKNKPSLGTITLAFNAKDSRQFEILVSDDGAGIDLDRVQAAAMKMGIVSRDAAGKLDPQEALSLIFQSGISTSPIITDISGRGLGLSIVREKVEKLGGVVSVESQPNVGTTFRLLLPMTLATFRGVLVRVDQHLFVLPTMNVERTLRVNQEEIKTVENQETIMLDGKILSAVRLADALELPIRKKGISAIKGVASAPVNQIPVVVVASAGKRIAFRVDEILDERQVLVKELGRQLKRVRNISGATVLGTGKVVPVINVSDLMKSAVRAVAAGTAAINEEEAPSKVGKILVVEDSITSRTLIKNILETAGYQVVTAVDGVDAFTQVLIGEFDLVVSDVDMPRMNGFELTAKIRADKKLSELPVVLVTALESREDRERGIEVGADAYIIKSSFDQSNLLDVIYKLL